MRRHEGSAWLSIIQASNTSAHIRPSSTIPHTTQVYGSEWQGKMWRLGEMGEAALRMYVEANPERVDDVDSRRHTLVRGRQPSP